MHIGVESGSERILEFIQKDVTLPQVSQAFDLLTRKIVDLRAYFMFGFPHETVADVEQTLAIMKELGEKGVGVIFSIFTPYPGTALYGLVQELGLLPAHPDWARLSHQSPDNYFSESLTRDDYLILLGRMVEAVEEVNRRQRSRGRSATHKMKQALRRWRYYRRHPGWFFHRVFSFPLELFKNREAQ